MLSLIVKHAAECIESVHLNVQLVVIVIVCTGFSDRLTTGITYNSSMFLSKFVVSCLVRSVTMDSLEESGIKASRV